MSLDILYSLNHGYCKVTETSSKMYNKKGESYVKNIALLAFNGPEMFTRENFRNYYSVKCLTLSTFTFK